MLHRYILLLSVLTPQVSLTMGLATLNVTAPNVTVTTTYSAPNISKIVKAQCTKRRKEKTTPACSIIEDHELPRAVRDALDKNNIDQVKRYFDHEPDFVKKRKQIKEALLRVAQKPPHERQEVVSFLLSEVYPQHIGDVQCLINYASHNGHTRIIDFVSTRIDPAELILPALSTILENDVDVLEILLAGLDANYRPSQYSFNPFVSYAVYYGRPECVKALVARKLYVLEKDNRGKSPISAACLIYKEHVLAKADDQECRLAVVQELFKGVPEDKKEQELAFQLASMPATLHANLTRAMNSTLYPAQLSMNDLEEYQKLKDDAAQFEGKVNSCIKRCALTTFFTYIACCVCPTRRP